MIICSSSQGAKKKSKLITKARSEIHLHPALSQSCSSKNVINEKYSKLEIIRCTKYQTVVK